MTMLQKRLALEDADDANKQAIQGFFWLPVAQRQRLLRADSPRLREQVVGRVRRRLILGLLLAFGVALMLLGFLEVPGNALLGQGAEQVDAGRIESIELHSGLLGDKTTVRTTAGTFQVLGPVSAMQGDAARVRRNGERGRMQLCLESQIRQQCYWIL
jgi:hypothetical protein